eukprot:5081371-Pyramimonas_sp.AAC.1
MASRPPIPGRAQRLLHCTVERFHAQGICSAMSGGVHFPRVGRHRHLKPRRGRFCRSSVCTAASSSPSFGPRPQAHIRAAHRAFQTRLPASMPR